jgi:predicted NBD/HSP70 family sugar kinase
MTDNRQHVFEIIRDRGPLRLVDIAQWTGLGQTTVRDVVKSLREVEAITQAETEQRGTGRPSLLYRITATLGNVVGVQFEPGSVRAAIANLGLEIVDQRERAVSAAEDAASALDAAAEMVDAMIGAKRIQRDRILGVAMAMGAPVDAIAGTVRSTTRLSSWIGLQPAAELEKRLGLPADVGNDATMAGLAESVVGAAKGRANVFYAKLSAAIGAGIVIDGRPYQGFAGTAGEFAHLVADRTGALCFCGNRGCLWTVIGGERILRELEQTTGPSAHQLQNMQLSPLDDRLEKVIELAEGGDLACQAMIREVGASAGHALVNVCNLLNPSTIVVGGTLSKAADMLLDPLRATVMRYTRHLSRRGPALDDREVQIVQAGLDKWSEVLGASAMALRSANPVIRQRLLSLIDET